MSKNTNKKIGVTILGSWQKTTHVTILASNDHFMKRDRDDFQDRHVLSREEL